MKKWLSAGAALIIVALIIVSWATVRHQTKPQKISIVGSTALQPLTEAVAHQYQQKHSGIHITIQGGGSGTGLSQVQAGAVDVGNSDVFASQQNGINAKKLRGHVVAVAGIVPIVNPNLPVNNLSMEQLRQIFTGKITNWQQVGGPNEKITVINRAHGSGTRVAFEQTVFKNNDEAVISQEQDSNGTVKEIVANTPGAISYITRSYVNQRVKPLQLNYFKATKANITTNRWPLWSYEHMYTKLNPNSATTQFIRYMQSPAIQQRLVNSTNYISIHDMKVKKTANNQIIEEK